MPRRQQRANKASQDVARRERGSLQQGTGEDFRDSIHRDVHSRYGRTPSVFNVLTVLTIMQRTTIVPVSPVPAPCRCEIGSTAQRRQRKGEIPIPLTPGPITSPTHLPTGTLTRPHGLSLITCQQVPKSTAQCNNNLSRLRFQTCTVSQTSSFLQWYRATVMARHITICRT